MISESYNAGVEGFLALDRRASEAPETIALLAPGRAPLTYGQLRTHLGDSHDALKNFGIGPDHVTALALPNGPELITAFLATASVGACAPLDPTLTEGDYQVYLSRLGARTLLVADSASTSAAAAARSLGIQILTVRGLQEQPAGVFELAGPGIEPTATPPRKTGAALLLFTSATTGSPRLVPLTWANLHAMAIHDSRALELDASDRLLSLMPLFHLHGLAAALTQLSCGGSVISTSGFDARSFLTWISQLRPTWFTSSPPMNRAILALACEHPEIFRDAPLRFIRSGTASLEPELLTLLENAAGIPVLNGYGLTETGGVARNTRAFRKPGSVGRSSGLEVVITDSNGNILPPGSDGEIVVRGPSITPGYLDNPEANRSAFRDGWFRTGDLGRFDNEGFLFITGRLKEMINRGGKKIAPQDVEAVLLAHPAVAEAAVTAIPHPTLGEDVAAAVVLRDGATASEPELCQFVASQLACFQVPRRIVLIDSIPRTSTGKPKRGLLSEQLGSPIPLRREAARALEPVEAVLVDIWRRILGVEQIDVADNFFALGGDSLAAAVMLTEAQRVLQTSTELLETVDFFDNPTIEALAVIVAKCGANAAHPDMDAADTRILALRSTGSRTPFFCFPAAYPDPYYFRHLSKGLGDEQPFFVVCPAHPVRDKRLLSVNEVARLSVATIRRVRSHGPYLIGGHCYGGVVAFETALRLASEGEQVTALVLFDVKTPGYPIVHKQWRQYFIQARELALAPVREHPGVIFDHVRALGRLVTRRFGGRASRALAAVGSDALVAGRDQKTLHGMTMGEYTPRDFPAPIIHFIAADQPISTKVLSDPRLDWRVFARAGVEERRVKGDHNSMFMASNAEAIAEQLNALLVGKPIASLATAAGAD